MRLGANLRKANATFEATPEEESGQRFESLYDRTARFAHAMENIPAATLVGLCEKAKAVAWTHHPDIITSHSFGDTFDERLAASIVRDLLAISAA
ncbi:MAG TPA: hypothetical protein VKS78_04305 [Roseiarcus sp.]|nr:hypothetical protein [Roseiarcus sp.]